MHAARPQYTHIPDSGHCLDKLLSLAENPTCSRSIKSRLLPSKQTPSEREYMEG